jgi:cytochrome c nitrite reductase small subunit
MKNSRKDYGLMQTGKKWFLISIALAVVLVGYISAGFTMRNTDIPEFCGNCHVMHEAVRTHQQSMHAKLTCNECHAPTDSFISKMIFKTRSGMRDIYVNTLGNIPDVVEAETATKKVINDNCVDCHYMTTINLDRKAKNHCVECHRHVPHSGKSPIALRKVTNE